MLFSVTVLARIVVGMLPLLSYRMALSNGVIGVLTAMGITLNPFHALCLKMVLSFGAIIALVFCLRLPMSEPLLTDVFGAGAVQDVSTVTVQKSALSAVGLTPGAANTAESILLSIIMIASNSLTESNRLTDSVLRNVSVSYSGQDLVEGSGSNFRRDAWTVLAYKDTPIVAVDPDDY